MDDGSLKAVRIVFKSPKRDGFVVVKVFEVNDLASVKYWNGGLEKVMSFWNTKTPIRDSKAKEDYIRRARTMMEEAFWYLADNVTF